MGTATHWIDLFITVALSSALGCLVTNCKVNPTLLADNLLRAGRRHELQTSRLSPAWRSAGHDQVAGAPLEREARFAMSTRLL